ncbi:hypothetical protein [Limnoglobus roseus]|nr:hypothetical protein [Limnoglobus roseus]
MSRTLLVLFALSTTAVPPPEARPDEALRAANGAARQGNFSLADTLLDQSAERSRDPGLIAFNRAMICFEIGDYREAEMNYVRCLDDRAIPEERRIQAVYNRGVCLLHRGEDAKLLRVAIGCFEQCLDSPATAGTLMQDVRHNLELAKLLWGQARAKQKEPPTPNESYEPEPPRAKPIETTPDDIGTEQNANQQANRDPAGTQMNPSPRTGSTPNATAAQQTPGAGTMPVVSGDAAEVQKLSPEDTTLLLDKTDARLRQARQKNEQMRAGPERPNVRDW